MILSRLPKNDELLKKWLLAVGKTKRKICESSRICSRHFKEDFRYSLVGGKRFLKRGAIPSLHLNEESNDDSHSDTGNVVETMDNKSLNIAISQVDARKDNQSSIIGMKIQIIAEDTCENTESIAHECNDKTQVPERISASSLDSSSSNELEKKYKKHLYDVRWEEISTSPVQAKIYWEVAIKRITRQKTAVIEDESTGSSHCFVADHLPLTFGHSLRVVGRFDCYHLLDYSEKLLILLQCGCCDDREIENFRTHPQNSGC